MSAHSRKEGNTLVCVLGRVNDSKYGLQAGVFTHDLDKARPSTTNPKQGLCMECPSVPAGPGYIVVLRALCSACRSSKYFCAEDLFSISVPCVRAPSAAVHCLVYWTLVCSEIKGICSPHLGA